MFTNKKFYCSIILLLINFHYGFSQSEDFIPIAIVENLNEFQNPGENWKVTSGLKSNYDDVWKIKKLEIGSGTVVNDVSKSNRSHLMTKKEFGDIELELDFMIEKGSNSGVYLSGRYKVQLFDSWLNPSPTFKDAGGIYQYWDETRTKKGFGGTAPLQNAAKAPGLWQHLKVRFKAPRFDDNGSKTSNALFEEVYLNGVLVQQHVEVTGPTRSAMFVNEGPNGPLVLQGDHGKVAFRNIRYRLPKPLIGDEKNVSVGPIVVKPDKKPYVLRSFLNFSGKKLGYAISVGTPQGIHYSYNVALGSWLQVWRGSFMDATEMWHSRGEAQIAEPMGNVIGLSNAPTIAALSSIHEKWPDAQMVDAIQIDGYAMDKQGFPTFRYTLDGNRVEDKIVPVPDGRSFMRTLTVEKTSPRLYCRVVSATMIEQVDKGLYRVDGSYYVKLERAMDPLIRNIGENQEMLLPLGDSKIPLAYHIIW